MKKRKIDVLKELLESQDSRRRDWPELKPVIREREGQVDLVLHEQQVGIAFSASGNRLLGMYNWKD